MAISSTSDGWENKLGLELIERIFPLISEEEKSRLHGLKLPETVTNRLFAQAEATVNEWFRGKQWGPEFASSSECKGFIENTILGVFRSMLAEANRLPKDEIADCGVSESAFTNAEDPKPFLATDSLVTCVGVAGYDSTNQAGFLVHFATEKDLEASGSMLLEKIRLLAKKPLKEPIRLDLRGGLAHASEPLVKAIKKWVADANASGCGMRIESEEVLRKIDASVDSLAEALNGMSMKLDTRDGALTTYERPSNPYVHQKIDMSDPTVNVDKILADLTIKVLSTVPGIKVVYTPGEGSGVRT